MGKGTRREHCWGGQVLYPCTVHPQSALSLLLANNAVSLLLLPYYLAAPISVPGGPSLVRHQPVTNWLGICRIWSKRENLVKNDSGKIRRGVCMFKQCVVRISPLPLTVSPPLILFILTLWAVSTPICLLVSSVPQCHGIQYSIGIGKSPSSPS